MLQILLGQQGYSTVSAYSGTEGVLIHGENIDLILLDLMLPGRSGEDIIKELKQKHRVPVIVLSAVHDVNRKVELFTLGADDYVTKPFHNEELLARIDARLRADAGSAAPKILTYRDIELNREDFTAKCADRQLELSRHEFAILQILMENPSRVCTKSMIFDQVWDYESTADSADDNTLNVHISRLRKRLKECNPDTDYIETVWGIGYRLKK
ncbi:MAG: response regulator transcription factor [Acetatifactor sp.]|nr:response regulator transcription factor [Acetatifactor sp.]